MQKTLVKVGSQSKLLNFGHQDLSRTVQKCRYSETEGSKEMSNKSFVSLKFEKLNVDDRLFAKPTNSLSLFT